MHKIALLAASLGLVAAASCALPAQAQQINQKARQKVQFYNAPREIQIIDERPMVRDFREGPVSPQMINLPPGPGAGKVGGSGGGALPDGGAVLPAGGMQIGGDGDPGYRTPNESSPVPLEKADFGHARTNIPAAGMGPKGPLPGGYTTGIHGRVSPPNYPQGMMAGPAQAGSRARPVAAGAGPAVSTYGGPGSGYGASVGSGSGAGGANTSVRGKLLGRVK